MPDATAWFAADQGFYAQNGLDVAIDIITNGGAIISGVMGGALDIGVCSIGTLATAHARGLPVIALAPGGIYNGALPDQRAGGGGELSRCIRPKI